MAIWSREGRSRYVASSSLARRMPDLGIPKMVVLAIRKSKAWLIIARRFRKSLPAASPPPSLAANSAVTKPRSSLVPSDGTALLHVSRRSANKLSIGMCDSCEPSAWRIVVGTNCTTPLSSVLVTVCRALAWSLKGVIVALARLIRGPGEAMRVVVVCLANSNGGLT